MSQLRAIVIAGFVVLLGAPLTASAERIFCESRDYHRNFCPTGGNVSNARLVVQQSQAACIQGRTWGYDRNGIWVTQGCSGEFEFHGNRPPPMPGPGRQVECDSRNYQQQFCPAGRRVSRAWLVEQRSQAACIQGRTWGYQQDGIWVSGGCSGLFAVEGGGGPPPGPPPINRVACESRDYQQAFCPAGPRVARAWVVDQRSQAPCINGQTWGFQGNGIWVTQGCSAVFAFESR